MEVRLDSAAGLGKDAKSPRRVKQRERVEMHDDGEGNWLVSYADMMTLLFAFFVILSAFSTPDAGKLEKLKEATTKSMGVDYVKPFTELSDSLKKVLNNGELGKEIMISENADGIVISVSGTLFFDSGSTELKAPAAALVDRVADMLVANARAFKIFVEGHTDDVPIRSEKFPSNWELSSARAGTVVRRLEEKGFPHYLLRPLGLADAEPMLPNRDEGGRELAENRARNRRIVIRIQKQLPPRMKKTAQ
jgi:chemotaxis protein MotB